MANPFVMAVIQAFQKKRPEPPKAGKAASPAPPATPPKAQPKAEPGEPQ